MGFCSGVERLGLDLFILFSKPKLAVFPNEKQINSQDIVL